MKIIKPTIVKRESLRYPGFSCSRYVCHDNFFIWGQGDTPKQAYEDWKEKESRRSRTPRRTIWNMRDCHQWYREGCKAIRYFLGGKQIIGYLPQTDELILRG